MDKNSNKNSGIKNLTPFKKGQSGNLNGRPLGQRNQSTLYRLALEKIGQSQNKTAEEIEEMMDEAGIRQAIKGNYQFYKDIKDRVHGKTPDIVHAHVVVEPNERIKELAKKLNG